MEAIMDAQGLWESIEPTASVAVDEKKSKMARAFIFQAIPEDILMQVAKKKTAREVWESLKTWFVGADRVQKARLHTFKSEFEALQMKDGESINEYAGKLSGMISKYDSVGATLNDEELVRKLFDMVTEKYIHLIASMEQHLDVEEMPFEEAIGRLKAYKDSKAPGGRGRGWNGDRGGRVGARKGRGSGRGRGNRYGKKPSQEECKNKKKPEQEVHLMREMEEDTLLLCVKGEHLPSMVMLNEDKCFLNYMKVGTVAIETCVEIKGKGTLLFQCKNGDQLMVSDMYFIPTLTSNILSLGCKTGLLGNFLVDDAWTWHARLGHANFYTLEIMGKKRMVNRMPCDAHPKQLCNGCVVAKQTRQSFPDEAQRRASKPLELVHTDLCGPITPQSTGGNRYFLLIVDDWCRHMWVYLLRSKDEALAKFKIFKAQVEMETAHKVKVLRTDHEERRNRTVVKRSMLKSMNLPDSLWAEAVRHAVYLLNKLPMKAVRDITPYEGWKKRKPNLECLKIFSCLAFVKKVGGHLTKLEDKSMPMVHLGMEPGSKAYRLYNPKSKRIVVARIGGGSGMAEQSSSSSSGSVLVNDMVPFDTFDDTLVRGTRLLQEIYEREPMMTEEEVQDKYQQVGLLLLNEEPTSFHEATKDIQWMEAMPLAAKENWIVHHLDVKSAFLNRELKEEVYVAQPTGFEVKEKEEMVYKLNKALYGLRQAPRSWNAKLDKIQDFKVRMNSIFDMSDLGKLNYYLGIEVKQEEDSIVIKQENYARKILKEAGMSKCNPAKWPMDPKLQLTKDEGGKEVDPTKYRTSTSILNTISYGSVYGERDQIYVEHVSGDLQKVDILTKALPRVKFTEMRRLIETEDVNIKGENVD
nr:putative zinc finger, CCHC-type [Tanacetum cinerariifolium]